MTTSHDDLAQRTSDLHDQLHAWLLHHCRPDVQMLAVLGALTYEIGLCVGRLEELQGTRMDDAALEDMLDGIRDTMRAQIRAYRAGLRS